MTYLVFIALIVLLTWIFHKLGSVTDKCFANENTDTMDGFTFGLFSNEAKAGTTENWVQISPYGSFKHIKGLQIFDRSDAEMICNQFHSASAIGVRVLGIPFYVGHPDVREFEAKYPDRRAYGRIKTLEARDSGLFANVKWSQAGKDLIESEAYHGQSVNWRIKQNARGELHPIFIKSVGFTNDPNIPVEPITAANEKQENIMDKKLIAKALGLSEDSTEEQIITAANESQKNVIGYAAFKKVLTDAGVKTEAEAIVTIANEAKTSKEKLGSKETEAANEKQRADQEKARADKEKERADKAVTDFANERKARSTSLIAAAIKDARITPAEKAGYEAEFANEATFSAAESKLAAAKSKLPTESRTGSLRTTMSPQSLGKVETINEFVNEVQTKNPKLTHDQAWASAKKQRPELFEKTAA